jgi:hypothetical protein
VAYVTFGPLFSPKRIKVWPGFGVSEDAQTARMGNLAIGIVERIPELGEALVRIFSKGSPDIGHDLGDGDLVSCSLAAAHFFRDSENMGNFAILNVSARPITDKSVLLLTFHAMRRLSE